MGMRSRVESLRVIHTIDALVISKPQARNRLRPKPSGADPSATPQDDTAALLLVYTIPGTAVGELTSFPGQHAVRRARGPSTEAMAAAS